MASHYCIGLPSKPNTPGCQNDAIASAFAMIGGSIGGSSDVLWGNDEVDGGNSEDVPGPDKLLI